VAQRALDCRALAGRIGAALKQSEAALLAAVIWPKEVLQEDGEVCARLLSTWHVQGLEFVQPEKVLLKASYTSS
jgi:hypothetical protein